MQRESFFKNRVIKRLKELDDIWFEKIQQLSIRGTPDIIGCYRGKFFAFELKVGSPVEALQQHKIDLINQAGGIGRIVTPENFDECMEELCRKN